MWGTMLENINPQNIDLSRIVAKSICALAPTSDVHFDLEAKREKIMGGILNLLKIEDSETIIHSLEALMTIA